MARGIAVINGRNFSHQDIVFNIGGVPTTSLSNISLTYRKIREFSYGAQELPVGYGDGRDEPVELTFELSKIEAEAIASASPNNNVTSIAPFDIPLTAINPSNPVLKTVKNVLITEWAESSDVDTTDIKVSFTAIASHVITI